MRKFLKYPRGGTPSLKVKEKLWQEEVVHLINCQQAQMRRLAQKLRAEKATKWQDWSARPVSSNITRAACSFPSLGRAGPKDTAVERHLFLKAITRPPGIQKAILGRAPAWVHMVCESFSLWHFYEGYVYVPFFFILLVLIAVYWPRLLCTETTCFPAGTARAAVCHMALLSSDKNLLLSDHNSWKRSALKSLSCWDSSWAVTWSTSTRNERVLWRQLMAAESLPCTLGLHVWSW